MSEIIHKFEAAGLGKAPFRFIGMETAADRAFVQKERESSGMVFTTNHSTSCDFCGTGIQNAFYVQSADGKRFKVGCECIRKAGDSGLMRVVKEEEAKKRREKADAKRKAKWQREAELLAKWKRGECEALKSQPHPKQRPGSTAWDYVDWCVQNHCVGALVLSMIESC